MKYFFKKKGKFFDNSKLLSFVVILIFVCNSLLVTTVDAWDVTLIASQTDYDVSETISNENECLAQEIGPSFASEILYIDSFEILFETVTSTNICGYLGLSETLTYDRADWFWEESITYDYDVGHLHWYSFTVEQAVNLNNLFIIFKLESDNDEFEWAVACDDVWVDGSYNHYMPWHGWVDDENADFSFRIYGEVDNNIPICSISANPSSGEVPLTTSFSLSASDSDGTINSWQLDVNDDGASEYSGSGSPPSSLSHTYHSTGDYSAKITVWDNDGSYGTDTTSISVTTGGSGVVLLSKAITCKWADGWQSHGVQETQFELEEKVYAYLEYSSDNHDFDGDELRYKWYHNGELVYEDFSICEGHYTGWAYWPSQYVGLEYGYGIGYVRAYWEGLCLGTTNTYIINDPPSIPEPISGPQYGYVNSFYNFSTSAEDSFGDISYGWDWGDGTPIEWSDWYDSGETCYWSHNWTQPGFYTLKVKAIDQYGSEVGWSESKTFQVKENNEDLPDLTIISQNIDFRLENGNVTADIRILNTGEGATNIEYKVIKIFPDNSEVNVSTEIISEMSQNSYYDFSVNLDISGSDPEKYWIKIVIVPVENGELYKGNNIAVKKILLNNGFILDWVDYEGEQYYLMCLPNPNTDFSEIKKEFSLKNSNYLNKIKSLWLVNSFNPSLPVKNVGEILHKIATEYDIFYQDYDYSISNDAFMLFNSMDLKKIQSSANSHIALSTWVGDFIDWINHDEEYNNEQKIALCVDAITTAITGDVPHRSLARDMFGTILITALSYIGLRGLQSNINKMNIETKAYQNFLSNGRITKITASDYLITVPSPSLLSPTDSRGTESTLMVSDGQVQSYDGPYGDELNTFWSSDGVIELFLEFLTEFGIDLMDGDSISIEDLNQASKDRLISQLDQLLITYDILKKYYDESNQIMIAIQGTIDMYEDFILGIEKTEKPNNYDLREIIVPSEKILSTLAIHSVIRHFCTEIIPAYAMSYTENLYRFQGISATSDFTASVSSTCQGFMIILLAAEVLNAACNFEEIEDWCDKSVNSIELSLLLDTPEYQIIKASEESSHNRYPLTFYTIPLLLSKLNLLRSSFHYAAMGEEAILLGWPDRILKFLGGDENEYRQKANSITNIVENIINEDSGFSIYNKLVSRYDFKGMNKIIYTPTYKGMTSSTTSILLANEDVLYPVTAFYGYPICPLWLDIVKTKIDNKYYVTLNLNVLNEGRTRESYPGILNNFGGDWDNCPLFTSDSLVFNLENADGSVSLYDSINTFYLHDETEFTPYLFSPRTYILDFEPEYIDYNYEITQSDYVGTVVGTFPREYKVISSGIFSIDGEDHESINYNSELIVPGITKEDKESTKNSALITPWDSSNDSFNDAMTICWNISDYQDMSPVTLFSVVFNNNSSDYSEFFTSNFLINQNESEWRFDFFAKTGGEYYVYLSLLDDYGNLINETICGEFLLNKSHCNQSIKEEIINSEIILLDSSSNMISDSFELNCELKADYGSSNNCNLYLCLYNESNIQITEEKISCNITNTTPLRINKYFNNLPQGEYRLYLTLTNNNSRLCNQILKEFSIGNIIEEIMVLNISSHCTDTNYNGKFEYLTFDIQLNVNKTGNYRIEGYLSDNSYSPLGNTVIFNELNQGLNNITLNYTSSIFTINSKNESYKFNTLRCKNLDTDKEIVIKLNYTTDNLHYSNFEQANIAFPSFPTDQASDEDDDGFFNYYNILLPIEINMPGNYSVEIFLYNNNGSLINTGINTSELPAGNHILKYKFDGIDLRKYGYNSSFNLNKIKIYMDGEFFGICRPDWELGYYEYTQFQPMISLLDSYSEFTIDLDSDGFYDYLQIDFLVNVSLSGNYSYRGSITDQNAHTVDGYFEEIFLNKGLNSCSLLFDGKAIYKNNNITNFILTDFLISYESVKVAEQKNDIFVTQTYDFNNFESSEIVNCQCINDFAFDSNNNGVFNEIEFEIHLDVKQSGKYLVTGYLYNSSNYYQGKTTNLTNLSIGNQNISLRYPSTSLEFQESTMEFNLSQIEIRNGDNNIVYISDEGYRTNVYNSSDFEEETYVFADLAISDSDISLSNPNPIDGELILINATIHNIGLKDASGIVVSFYEDSPNESGSFIGDDLIENIEFGSSKSVEIFWEYHPENVIFIVIDPMNYTQEENESNNIASYWLDDISPSIHDLTFPYTFTNVSFDFIVNVSDGSYIDAVIVEYWYGAGNHVVETMERQRDDQCIFKKIIAIDDTDEPIHYTFTTTDIAGNEIVTNTKDIAVIYPKPCDGEKTVNTDVNLSWIKDISNPEDVVKFDIYFSNINPPEIVSENQSNTFYLPEPLINETKYFWKLNVRGEDGQFLEGPVWNFSTNFPPYLPSSPKPYNNSSIDNISTTLQWIGDDFDAPYDNLSYDLYFGNSTNPPLILSNISNNNTFITNLRYSETYYWRIISYDSKNASSVGPLWHFNTNYHPMINNENPINNSIDVDIRLSEINVTIEDLEGDNFNWSIELFESPKKSYVFAAYDSEGLYAYLYNESSFDLLDIINDGDSYVDVYADDNFVYASCQDNGLKAYTFDGCELTLLDSIDNGSEYKGIYSDGSHIYVACGNEGLKVYLFDGEHFTLLDSIDDGDEYDDVYSDGDYIYTTLRGSTATSGLYAYSFNGTSLTLLDKFLGSFWYGVYSDGSHIYAGRGNSGLNVFDFDGEEFTFLDSDGKEAWDVHGFNNYIYSAMETDGGIGVYTFDGSSLTRITSHSGCDVSIFSDRNFIFSEYIDVTGDDKIRAYSFNGKDIRLLTSIPYSYNLKSITSQAVTYHNLNYSNNCINGTKKVNINNILKTNTNYKWEIKCKDSFSWNNKTFYFITSNQSYLSPTANFSFSPTNPSTADTISFTDASYDLDGYLINWTWDLGDGNTSFIQNPTHTYSDDGIYNVCLTVFDNDNISSNKLCKIISVDKANPICNFTFQPTNPTINQAIHFSDESTDTFGTIINWTWNFGDGNFSYDQNPIHQYCIYSTYVVNLTVVNNLGFMDSYSESIQICDLQDPEVRNQNQNSSTIKPNGTIELFAQIRDDFALDYAWLSTNESGEWQNISMSYGGRQFYKELFIEDSEQDYQIPLVVFKEDGYDDISNGIVDCENHSNINFSDIVFLDTSLNLLPYWIEEICTDNTDHFARIWIRLSGTDTIYMCYGNENASSQSNGTATFPAFFYDMSHDPIDDWHNNYRYYAVDSDSRFHNMVNDFNNNISYENARLRYKHKLVWIEDRGWGGSRLEGLTNGQSNWSSPYGTILSDNSSTWYEIWNTNSGAQHNQPAIRAKISNMTSYQMTNAATIDYYEGNTYINEHRWNTSEALFSLWDESYVEKNITVLSQGGGTVDKHYFIWGGNSRFGNGSGYSLSYVESEPNYLRFTTYGNHYDTSTGSGIIQDYYWMFVGKYSVTPSSWIQVTSEKSKNSLKMQENDEWQWANFTWQNPDVQNGTTVGWKIYFSDTSGNINSTDIMSFTVSALTTTQYDLDIGWNLISPSISQNWNASDLAVFFPNSEMISRFDSTAQSYDTYFVGGPSSFDFQLVAGDGYFILMTEPNSTNLTGPRIPSVSIPLNLGWNLLGWYHTENTMASSLGENITGCEMVSWFDASTQGYETYFVGGPSSFDFEITSGMGIFVLVDEESTWHGEG